LIDASAKRVSGANHCFFQTEASVRAGAIVTRNVNDISFIAMLERRSRIFGPPHVVLITAEHIWLWSFSARGFVPWEGVRRVGEGVSSLEGPAVIGRPSVANISECDRMIASN